MKKYSFGNIVIEINSEIAECDDSKFELFLLSKNEKSDEVIYINKKESVLLPAYRSMYREEDFEVWKSQETEIRAYSKLNQVHAVLSINSKNNRLEFVGKYHDDKISIRKLFNYIALEKIFLKHNAIVIHSSFVICEGKAVLFSAPSGTGKSTQADLWGKYKGAEIVNGDRTLIKYDNGCWMAYGLPFSGSSEYCKNRSAPINAIICLNQSKTNQAQKMRSANAVKKLYSEITVNYWDSDYVNKTLDLIEDLVSIIPVYEYRCTKYEGAVSCLYEVLYGESKDV